jgi:hypothetical protein
MEFALVVISLLETPNSSKVLLLKVGSLTLQETAGEEEPVLVPAKDFPIVTSESLTLSNI